MIINNGVSNTVVEEISIEQLAEDIDMLKWEKGILDFHVEENFELCEKLTYTLQGLTMEYDDEIVCCRDYGKILINNIYLLMGFLKDCVLKIKRTITDTERRGEIFFKDGNLTISVRMT